MSATTLNEFREVREESLSAIVARRKWAFGSVLAAVVAGGLVWTFVATPLYEATSTVVFPLKTNSVLTPAQALAASGALGGALGVASPLRQSQFLLESPAATAQVAKVLGLSRTDTEKLRRIDNNPAANAIVVRATNEDPKQARRICHLYVDALRSLTDQTGDAGEKGDLGVLSRRIAESESAAAKAQKELANFQKGLVASPGFVTAGSSVVVLPGPWLEEKRRAELDLKQIEARMGARRQNVSIAASMAAKDPTNLPTVRPLRDQLVSLDLDLRTAKSLGGPQSPDVLRLQGQIDQTKVTLRHELEAYLRAFHANVTDGDMTALLTDHVAADARLRSVSRMAASAPEEAARYQSLLERVGGATDMVERLKAQRASAELQSESDPNRWSVLDDAILAEKPVNKSYLQALLVFGALGSALASGLACLVDRRAFRREVVRR